MTSESLTAIAKKNFEQYRKLQSRNPRVWFPSLVVAMSGSARSDKLTTAYERALIANKTHVTELPEDIVDILSSYCFVELEQTTWMLGNRETDQVIFQAAQSAPSQVRFLELLRHTYDNCLDNGQKPTNNSEPITDFWELWGQVTQTETVLRLLSQNDLVQAHTVINFLTAHKMLETL